MRSLFRTFLVIAPIALAFGACKTTKSAGKADLSPAMPDIVGTQWRLVELMGQPVSTGGERPMFIELTPEENRFHGYAGCNSFTGSYTITDGSRITFTKVASTMMACPDMETERQLFEVFDQADNYSLGEGTLSLNKARMAPLARFEAIK